MKMEILPYLQSLESPDQPLSITYIQPDLHPNLTANNTSNFADRNVCATNMNVLFFFFCNWATFSISLLQTPLLFP